MVSRSTGRPYYWNAELNKSQFEHPSTSRSDQPNDTVGLPPGWVKMQSRSTGRPYYFNSRLQLSQFKHPGECVDELTRKLAAQNQEKDKDGHTDSTKADSSNPSPDPTISDQKSDQKSDPKAFDASIN